MKIAVLAFLLLATTAFGSNVQSCYLKFFPNPTNTDIFFTDAASTSQDRDENIPTTWTVPNPPNDGSEVTFTSLRAVAVDEEWYCSEVCKLTVYSRPAFGGRSESYYLVDNENLVILPFCAKSYNLDCGPYVPEIEYPEEEEEEEELSEEGYYEEEEQE